MTDPQPAGGRHARERPPGTAWDVLSGPWPVSDEDASAEPVDAAVAGGSVPTGQRADGRSDTRFDRLRADLLDRLPAGGQRVAVGLGRHWWLPVVVVIAALALAVGAVFRARPVLAGMPQPVLASASSPAAGASVRPATTGGAAPSLSPRAPAAASPLSTGPPAAVPSTSTASAAVVVDVAGRVRHPGVVRLPGGARIIDAIAAAGGALPGIDLTPLDLAQPLSDGEQIRVGIPGSPVAPATPATTGGAGDGAATGGATSPPATVDVNTADAEQLDTLPGIGPVLAARIVAWRTAHGPFATVDDLEQVPGIGAATLARFRAQIRAGP